MNVYYRKAIVIGSPQTNKITSSAHINTSSTLFSYNPNILEPDQQFFLISLIIRLEEITSIQIEFSVN